MLPVVQGIAALMNNGAGMAPEVFYFGLLTGATLGGTIGGVFGLVGGFIGGFFSA